MDTILGKSVGEDHFVRLRQRGDPSDGLLSRHHALLLWLEPEVTMYLDTDHPSDVTSQTCAAGPAR